MGSKIYEVDLDMKIVFECTDTNYTDIQCKVIKMLQEKFGDSFIKIWSVRVGKCWDSDFYVDNESEIKKRAFNVS